MPVYLISDVTPRNAEAFEAYRTRAAASIERHGGKYLVRGGEIDVLEGSWTPRALVVVEFPDRASAQAWYRSSDYAEALAVRDDALERNLILVEGTSP
jgi:uncharacterized protein (DUF1330 family)